jgi:hypothetical protein
LPTCSEFCLHSYKETARTTPTQIESLQLIFRSYQLLISRFNRTYNEMIGVAYFLVNTTMIMYTYEIIVYNSELHVLSFVIALSIGMLGLCSGSFYQLAIRMRQSSVQFVTSYQRNGRLQGPVEATFWKSCYPIEVWVGGIFTISSRHFLLFVFCEIILITTINLMLTFPANRRNA